VTARSVPRRRTRRGGGLGLGDELSAVIAAADEELLGYIRANTNPEEALAAMRAANMADIGALLAPSMPGHDLGDKASRRSRHRRKTRVRTGSRRRRRWVACAAAVGAAALVTWLSVLTATDSVRIATTALPVLAAPAATCVIVMRWPGVGTGHPWARGLASRPWRDGCDVLNAAVRNLDQVFVGLPGEILLAPNAVELLMNPDDLDWLADLIDIHLVSASIAERYEVAVARHAARLDSDDPVTVNVARDPAVPVGRYRLRRHRPREDADPAAPFRPAAAELGSPASGESAQPELAGVVAARTALATMAEPVISPSALRLLTNGAVAETRLAHARAGRGWEAELQLPEEPTVSRVHAEFTFAGGQWWITSRGRNGLMLNGAPLSGEQIVRPGDKIRWGQQHGALISLVEIG
jgi:FHA domain